MKINSINPTTFNASARIFCSENKENKYLYNHVLNMTKEFKIPATFHTDMIELPSVTTAIVKKLNNLGIKFSNK